jgi:hypothetical protein
MVTEVRPDRRVSTILACAAVAVAAFAGINVFHAFGPVHLHDDGPLVGPGNGFSFDADAGPGPWTIGYQLCVNQGTDPVILESIAPTSGSGKGLHFLGGYARLIPADSGGAIGDVNNFPPQVPEVLQPVDGFAVTQQCNFNSGQPPAPTSTSEVDVGVGKVAGSTGGGWSAFTVDYRVGSTQYVVTFDAGLYICGPTAPAAAECGH